MKKRLTLIIVALLLLGICTSCTSNEAQTIPPESVVAVINGENVTKAESDYFYSRLRAKVMSELLSEYTTEYSSEFWSTPLGGTTPEETLNQRALEECYTAKLQLVLCRENGIYDDISFEGLRKKAEAFNNENLGKSGVVGLTSIDLDTFYTYYIDNGVLELKNILAQSELVASDAEIQQYIDSLSPEKTEEFSLDTLRAHASQVIGAKKYDEYIARLRSEATITVA